MITKDSYQTQAVNRETAALKTFYFFNQTESNPFQKVTRYYLQITLIVPNKLSYFKR